MPAPLSAFVEPPWSAPLDAPRAIAAIPEQAQIRGMFFLALIEGAERRQITLAVPKRRYLQFGFYPVKEFATLLVEAATRFHPDVALRQGLRRIGKVGPAALLSSTLGKVTLGASEGVQAAVTAIVKTYAINVRPSSCDVTEAGPRALIVRMDNVPHFLDCHHVGVFEGALEYAGACGEVRIYSRGQRAADLLLRW
ncbi:MAG TPA: DUF2378 family protein [Polyangiaceae bacterium]|nr:DUF2378 family protein [Polyangiaceae bacterium]